MKTRIIRFTGIVMAIVMLVGFTFSTRTYAAGTETLPIGYTRIGGFTFTDTNLTPVKTVSGRYMNIFLHFKKADIDAGIGNVKLTVNVRDANTGQIISPTYVWTADPENKVYTSVVLPKVDLGYSNRRVQIWFDASSTGQSNGNYRSITFSGFNVDVWN